MALGYERVLADFYWMRVIQYYGRRDEADKRPIRYKNLSTLLEITTTLDPGLLDAYRAGSLFLAEPDPVGAGQPQEALHLLDKGIHAHPQEWKLFYDKGFIYYWHMKDYKAAGEIWRAEVAFGSAPLDGASGRNIALEGRRPGSGNCLMGKAISRLQQG